jgi:microcystin-dependent protein
MPSTFSTSLRLELIGDGEQSGVWGQTTNNNFGELVEQAITGRTTLDVTSGNITLTSLNGVVDEARSAVLAVTGTPGVTRVLTIPNVKKAYTVINSTTNIIQIKTASGTAFDCPPSATSVIACDGLNVVQGSGIAPLTSPAFTGVPTAPTAAIGTSTTQLATTAFVQNSIPVGLITLWSGSIASIPSGWALCNGSSGTPDLRDRFVVGAGSAYAVAATGGFNTITLDTTQIPSHTHTGTTAATDLSHTHTGSGTTGGNNVDHSHTGSGTTSGFSNDHTHSGTTAGVGDHAHVLATAPSENASPRYPWGASGSSGSEKQTSGGVYTAALPLSSGAGAHSHSFSTGGQSANHTHTYSFTTSGQSTSHNHSFSFTTSGASVSMSHTHTFTSNATGGGLAHENRPPYYALAYIMKVA